jgi:HAD superfamily hydrolase (TIGR01509 family)
MLSASVLDTSHLGLGDIVRIDSTDGAALMMNLQHQSGCILGRFLEEPAQDVDDEFHWGVIVVKKNDAVHRRPFKLGLSSLHLRRIDDFDGALAHIAIITQEPGQPRPVMRMNMQKEFVGMRELKCLLWDVDGTLADTERDGHRVAFNLAFDEAGVDRQWDVPTYGELLAVTGGKERIRHDYERRGLEAPAHEDIASLHARKTSHYQDLIAAGRIPLRPGVRRLLTEAFEAGITLAVATTTTPAALDALIEHSLGPEWFDRFAVRAAGDIVPAKKPAPDIYVYAMQELGLSPDVCLAMEDSGNGWRAARDAGLRCVVTVNDYTRGQDFRGADLVVSEFGEPDAAPIEVLDNPHGLGDLHHVRLAHLRQIMA